MAAPVGAVLLALALLGPGRPRSGARAALDLQELRELKYGIEILAEPVLAGQRPAADVVTVASRFQQRYECRLPPARRPPAPDGAARRYNGSGMAELLRPLAAGPCLVKTKDWWTYEFCYGRHIQQYHVEESEIRGDVLVLGYYQSASDWDDETTQASKQHRLKRYHSQSYVNGSRCDVTGRAREAEVRFLCEEGAGDYVARVDEPQSCSYVLTVHTGRVCRHPWLRPPPAAAPRPILCQPALSPAQYVQYVRAQVSDTKRKVEEISEELRTLDTRLWSEREPAAPALPPAAAAAPGDEADAGAQARVRQGSSAQDEEPPGRGAELPGADSRRKIHVKVIRSPGDLLRFLEELKEGAGQAPEKVTEEEEEEEATEKAAEEEEEKAAEEEEEEATGKAVEEEEVTEKAAEEEEEAVKSPEPPGPAEAPGAAAEDEEDEEDEEEGELLRGLERELRAALLPRARAARLREELKSAVEREPDGVRGEVRSEPGAEGLKGDVARERAAKSLASTLHRLAEELHRGAEEEEQEEEEEGPAGTTGPPGRARAQLPRGGRGDAPPRVPAAAPAPPRLQRLERQLRELLAREGLRAEGRIEVKVVAAGGGEDEARWLSDEDTRHLRDIVGILVQGTEAAQRERRRQRALEDNYRLVWGGPRREPPPARDADEPDL